MNTKELSKSQSRRPHAGAKSKGLKPETSTLHSGNLPEKCTRPSPPVVPVTRLAQGRRRSGGRRRGRLGAGVSRCQARSVLTRGSQARGLLLPGPRRLPGRLPRGRRCHSSRRAAAAAPVGGERGERAAPEAPRPPPAPSPGAPAPRLGRFLSARGGGEPASRAGVARAQLRGRRSRPSRFRSIVRRLTQSAATWPRLAPSPPGAPRPRGSRRARLGRLRGRVRERGSARALPSWEGDARDRSLAPAGKGNHTFSPSDTPDC
ncbi:translation initiation factor IF-2-like [Pteropus medius]|uniref:translation initiation factor IF-2-like n=1 Tax=Pteropus vampyrus TaxID=132908 RepID=UPI00196AC850|nr:translation initiation factor IF-2-like [Pteropus giganteus]